MKISFDKYYIYGFLFVFLAGLFWSFGAVIVRYMVDGHLYQAQYLFCRGISIAIILLLYLFFKEGINFYKNFYKVGLPGILGGIFLSCAFIGFIFSITLTTAAVTLFMLAAMPFIAAIVGYIFLKENLRKITFISMLIAFIGVLVMIYNDSIEGSVLGAFLGFFSAAGFAFYTVTIRWKPEVPKFTTVVLAGIICSTFSFFYMGSSLKSFSDMPTINIYWSFLHGSVVATGLILYSIGGKYLPSAELALLSLMEVVGGVLWVWLPFFGINEVPSLTVIIGGFIITGAVILHGVGASKKRDPVTL